MPTYEYLCHACEHRFERFQKISERPIRTCPECGERSVERLISAGGGLVFKGPGFYATDYRKGGRKEGDGEAKSKEESGEKGGKGADRKGGKTGGGSGRETGGETGGASRPAGKAGDAGSGGGADGRERT